MKSINDILKGIKIKSSSDDLNHVVESICFDSRKATKGSLFVAVKGSASDGHDYINTAIEQGCSMIVCENKPSELFPKVNYITVDDTHYALGIMASNFYDNPSEKLILTGITGTNGKTTTVTLLYRLFCLLGYKTGLLSTVENKINEKTYEATHTTPDPIQLNSLLKEMVEEGCEYCFMEVSSHALDQKRTAGLQFKGAIFSNITHDHLDYHKTFESYLKAKKSFFDNLSSDAFAITNFDDKKGKEILSSCKAVCKSYAMKTVADFKVRLLESHFNGSLITLDGRELWINLIGEFNAYNVAAIYSTAILLNQDKDEVLKHLSSLREVRGRFETYRSTNNITAIIDYAHTPDAVENVLKTINKIRGGNGQLITVIGAGGNRDKTKRPIMAKIAVEMSDKVILTSDNPRFEEPEDILKDMEVGIPISLKRRVVTIINREEAIKTACMLSGTNDVILVAGKGHETYQDVKGVKHHFDDLEIVKEYLK